MPKAKKAVKKTRRKRHGLRFVFSMILILGACGTVFWFGWVQFELEEGTVGVIHTKSHGYETEPIISGEFEWRWQALLPTNLTLHVYNLSPRRTVIEKSGTLPSGKLYAAMAGQDVAFEWNIKTAIRYRLTPESLPSMVAQGMVSSDLESFYAEYESRLEGMVSRLIAAETEGDPTESPAIRIERLERELAEEAAKIDEKVTILDATVMDWSYPDMVLYNESRRLVLDLMTQRQALLEDVESVAVRREDLEGSRLDLLERYGKVLDSYPVLLELFALEGNPGAVLLPQPLEQP
jgi:hypothetical protein